MPPNTRYLLVSILWFLSNVVQYLFYSYLAIFWYIEVSHHATLAKHVMVSSQFFVFLEGDWCVSGTWGVS